MREHRRWHPRGVNEPRRGIRNPWKERALTACGNAGPGSGLPHGEKTSRSSALSTPTPFGVWRWQGSKRRGGSPASDGWSRCAGVKFFEGCNVYRGRRQSHDPMRPNHQQSSSLMGCRAVQRPSVQSGRALRNPRWNGCVGYAASRKGGGLERVWQSRSRSGCLWRQRVRWSLSSSRSERAVSESETVQTLSVWDATFPNGSGT